MASRTRAISSVCLLMSAYWTFIIITHLGVKDAADKGLIPWSFTDPRTGNRWRRQAKGHHVRAFPIWLYCDDTSGNLSKKWNKHNSFLFTPAGLPRSLVHQEENIHFLSTSNIAPPLEMLDGIVDQLQYDAWFFVSTESTLTIAVHTLDNARRRESGRGTAKKKSSFLSSHPCSQCSGTTLCKARSPAMWVSLGSSSVGCVGCRKGVPRTATQRRLMKVRVALQLCLVLETDYNTVCYVQVSQIVPQIRRRVSRAAVKMRESSRKQCKT